MIGDLIGGMFARVMTALDAFLTTTIQEWLFVQGKMFSYSNVLTLPAGITSIVFDPTAFTGDNVTILPITFSSESETLIITYYGGTIEDGDGTPLPVTNRREGFPAPVTILTLDPTITDKGVSFSADSVWVSGVGTNTNSAANTGDTPFAVLFDNKKLIEIDNEGVGGTRVQIKMTWTES